MNKISLILMGIMTLALVVILAPNVLAMNRGRILRNIALWLAAFAGLALVYQNFGPGSEHPLFSMPESMVHQQPMQKDFDRNDDNQSMGDRGYTPPKE